MIALRANTHITVDKTGVAWIDDTKVKVVEVLMDHLAYGHSPEEIHLQHPHLSLAQIHAAFAYYFDHQAGLDMEIVRRQRRVKALRARAGTQPSRNKLLARLKRR
jgi:uncharacterized protein (DUF433 family)